MATRSPEAAANGSRASIAAALRPDLRRQLADADDRRRLLRDGRAARPRHDHGCPAGLARTAMSIGPSRSSFTRHARRRARTTRFTPRSRPRSPMAPRRPSPDRQRPWDANRDHRQRHRCRAIPILPGQLLANRNFVAGSRSFPNSMAPRSPESSRPRPTIGSASPASRRARSCSACAPAGSSKGRQLDCLRYAQPCQGALFCRREPPDVINMSLAGPMPSCCASPSGSRAWPRDRGRRRSRPQASRRRLSRIDARGHCRVRRVRGRVARRRLHRAGARRADHAAGRTMVYRQWKLVCRGPRQRPRRADARASAFGAARA